MSRGYPGSDNQGYEVPLSCKLISFFQVPTKHFSLQEEKLKVLPAKLGSSVRSDRKNCELDKPRTTREVPDI